MGLFSKSITYFVDNYGRKYKGDFKYNNLEQFVEGNGIMVNEEGDVYKGEFRIYQGVIIDNYINFRPIKGDWRFKGTVKLIGGDRYKINVEYGSHSSIEAVINKIALNNGNVYEGNIKKMNFLKTSDEFRLDKLIQEGYFRGKLVSSTGQEYELSNFNGDGITPNTGKFRYPTGEIYEGEFDVNMNPKGEGQLIDNDGSICKGTFSENGIENGQKIYENGLVYEGNFDIKGNMIGIGSMICEDKSECTVEFDENGILKRKVMHISGNIEEGKFNKNGILIEGKRIYKNGNIEEGKFNKNGILIEGKRIYKNGNIEEGKFNENGILIEGKRIYKNGNIEEGKFNEKGTLAKGKIIDKNGNSKEGEFNKNKSLIKGKIQWANGYIEEGQFNEVCKLINGISVDKDGYARKVYSSGRICEGNLNINGKLEGKGKIIYPNGEIYEGDFNKNEKLEGKGKIIYPNGEVYEGIFENGILPPIEIKNLEIVYREIMDDFIITMKLINKYYKPIRKIDIVTILLDKNKLPLLDKYDDSIESYYTINQNIMPQEESDTIQLTVDDNRIIDQVDIFIQNIEFFGAPKWKNKNIDNIIKKYNNKFFA